jgi:signal transduction histidine kinase
VLATLGLALIAYRLLQAQQRFVERRTEDLEQFASRLAHDIRAPITTAQLALDRVSRQRIDEASSAIAARGSSSLRLVDRIVVGLLEFARSGAAPEAGAHADVAQVLADVAAQEAPTAAAARVTITVEPMPPLAAACSPGVLASLASNLLSNAVKHMGDAPVRAVVMRASRRDHVVHVEVEDTGPGLPLRAETLFEPYVRGDARTPGPRRLGGRALDRPGQPVLVRAPRCVIRIAKRSRQKKAALPAVRALHSAPGQRGNLLHDWLARRLLDTNC